MKTLSNEFNCRIFLSRKSKVIRFTHPRNRFNLDANCQINSIVYKLSSETEMQYCLDRGKHTTASKIHGLVRLVHTHYHSLYDAYQEQIMTLLHL